MAGVPLRGLGVSSGRRRSRVASPRGAEGGENVAHLRVITREAVAPLEARALTRPQHEGPALLDRVPAPGSLSEPARERANALEKGKRVEGSHPAAREPGGPESAERGIGEEWPVIARRLAESRDVLGPAAAHHDHRGALEMKGRSQPGRRSARGRGHPPTRAAPGRGRVSLNSGP